MPGCLLTTKGTRKTTFSPLVSDFTAWVAFSLEIRVHIPLDRDRSVLLDLHKIV